MVSTEASAKQQPTRMYFLRMPKPDTSDLEFRKEQVETELKAYKQACSKALAAAKLAHERKLQRKEEHSQSNEQFQVSKQDRNTLRDRLRPVSDLSRQVRDQRRDINDRKSQLPASTVAELDGKIADLEFKQAHEPMDRRDENNLIADIRKLKKCRPDVARFEMEYQAVCIDLSHCADCTTCFILASCPGYSWRRPEHTRGQKYLSTPQPSAFSMSNRCTLSTYMCRLKAPRMKWLRSSPRRQI